MVRYVGSPMGIPEPSELKTDIIHLLIRDEIHAPLFKAFEDRRKGLRRNSIKDQLAIQYRLKDKADLHNLDVKIGVVLKSLRGLVEKQKEDPKVYYKITREGAEEYEDIYNQEIARDIRKDLESRGWKPGDRVLKSWY